MQTLPAPLHPPSRVLLGPGPSVVEPSVLSAMARPTLGHLDPAFLKIMDEVRAMTRAAFRTENELTLPMSGTGSAGMETCVVNLVEPGDRVLVGVNGVFGTRLAEVARRAGGEVVEVAGEWGRALSADAFREAAQGGRFDVLCVVHAETSTGALQPIPPIRAVADELGALLLVDGVTSLGGHELLVDEWGIDAIYSGTQKCLSCPPVSFSTRARAKIEGRKTPVQSWYLDLTLLMGYWGDDRAYHHTAPIQNIYGLHEALRVCLTEGLEERWNRHARNAARLVDGLARLGLEPRVPADERLTPLTAVSIPDGVDDGRVRAHMLAHFDVEIGGGLGPMKGNTWRIGLMGAGSTKANVALCLAALDSALREQGHGA